MLPKYTYKIRLRKNKNDVIIYKVTIPVKSMVFLDIQTRLKLFIFKSLYAVH